MPFSQTLLSIWTTTTYPQMSNVKTVIAEAEHYLLFNTLLFHFTVKSSKTVEHKMDFVYHLN